LPPQNPQGTPCGYQEVLEAQQCVSVLLLGLPLLLVPLQQLLQLRLLL
jgi:hypothetical protein